MVGPGLGGALESRSRLPNVRKDHMVLTASARRYMGYTGLISDNIVEMAVVMADGSETKVSQTSNPDL